MPSDATHPTILPPIVAADAMVSLVLILALWWLSARVWTLWKEYRNDR